MQATKALYEYYMVPFFAEMARAMMMTATMRALMLLPVAHCSFDLCLAVHKQHSQTTWSPKQKEMQHFGPQQVHTQMRHSILRCKLYKPPFIERRAETPAGPSCSSCCQ